MEVYAMVILALAGLGVMLYGMTLFGKALEPTLNYGLGRRFATSAKNPLNSYFVSSAVTFLTQKVTLTCGMVMGFVDVGTVSLKQSIAFVLGISFGSAISMILLMFQGFSLTLYLTLLCFFGAIILLFFKSPRAQNIAKGMMGFGMLFLGLELVGTYATEIFALPAVYDFLSAISNPFVVILIGLLFSFVTTSTFASLTVLSALVGVAGCGPISIDVAFLGMLAVAVGSALSDYMYTVSGQSTQAKRVITFHVLFRLFSFVLCFPLFFTPVIDWLYGVLGANAVMTLIIVHMVQMTVPSLLLLPFGKPLAKLMEKIVPERKSKDDLVADFILPDNALAVFGVGYPSLLKSIDKLLALNSDAQALLIKRISSKKETRGLLGRLKSIEKAVKITSNSTIRLSGKVGEHELPKLNVLVNIMGDLHYLGERSTKLYNLGSEIIKKSKIITDEQVKFISQIFDEIEIQYNSLKELINTLINGQDITNKQLREIMTNNKAIYASGQKLKQRSLVDYRKTGRYSKGSDTYFGLMLILEDINTDLANIAIKLGILSG